MNWTEPLHSMPPLMRYAFAGLHVIALVLLVTVVVAWGRHPGRRRLVGSGFAFVAAAAIPYLIRVRPRDIPVAWFTVLHNISETASIHQLSVRGVHAGANYAAVLSAVSSGPTVTLHDIVWLNLLLALVNAALFLHLAAAVQGRVWAALWTLAFALNPATFQASFSELPSHLIASYLLAGVLGWAVLTDAMPQPRAIRRAAAALLVVLTALMGATRIELSLLGSVALGLHFAPALVGPAAWSAGVARLGDRGRRLLVFLREHPVAVAALCLSALVPGLLPMPWRYLLAGIHPFNPSFFALPVVLLLLALPVGLVAATALGFAHGLVHFRKHGGLALSVIVVFRMYFAAKDGYYEMIRYLTYVLPGVFVLGLFGCRALEELATARRWPATVRRAVHVGYVMAWFGLTAPGTFEHYLPLSRPDPRGGLSQLLLDRNPQREVRYLAAAVEREPECVFVGRVVGSNPSPRLTPVYRYALFGGPLPEPFFAPPGSALEDVIAEHAPGARCVRLYHGYDCNLTHTDRCRDFVEGRRLLDETRFSSRPYGDPGEVGFAGPEVVLATYAWP